MTKNGASRTARQAERAVTASKLIPFVDLKRQYLGIRDEIDSAVQEVVESGRYVMGARAEGFEREFAGYIGVKHGVGVGSGTDALALSLRVLGIDKPSEVITVSFTFTSSVDCIVHNGAVPVFVDIDPSTFTIDVSKIEKQISKKTKAILPVHLYGHPVDIKPLLEIAEKHGLIVIEDAAQAHGAEYEGKKVGGFGRVACFSFYPAKNLGAYGDAGMITTNDTVLAERLRGLREYGQTKKYHHDFIGFNSRLDEMQAAVLRVKLKHLDSWNESRRANARLYGTLLSESAPNLVTPKAAPWATSVYHVYAVRALRRDSLKDWLSTKGISTLIHYPIPVHLQKSYANVRFRGNSLFETERCANEVLSLPMFPELSSEEIRYVCEAIAQWHKKP